MVSAAVSLASIVLHVGAQLHCVRSSGRFPLPSQSPIRQSDPTFHGARSRQRLVSERARLCTTCNCHACVGLRTSRTPLGTNVLPYLQLNHALQMHVICCQTLYLVLEGRMSAWLFPWAAIDFRGLVSAGPKLGVVRNEYTVQ